MMNSPESNWRQKAVLAVAVLAIVGSLIAVIANMAPQSAKLNRGPYIGLGQAVATVTAKTIHEQGQIGAIITANHLIDGLAPFDTWQAFCQELKKHRALRLVTTETISNETFADSGEVRIQFDNIIRKYPNIHAIVFLCGMPSWDPGRPFELPPNGPKIISVENEPAPLIQPYFANGSLAVAIVPRLVIDDNPVPPVTSAAWFSRQYQIYTPENYRSQFGVGGQQ